MHGACVQAEALTGNIRHTDLPHFVALLLQVCLQAFQNRRLACASGACDECPSAFFNHMWVNCALVEVVVCRAFAFDVPALLWQLENGRVTKC